jgi:hypothetical protein
MLSTVSAGGGVGMVGQATVGWATGYLSKPYQVSNAQLPFYHKWTCTFTLQYMVLERTVKFMVGMDIFIFVTPLSEFLAQLRWILEETFWFHCYIKSILWKQGAAAGKVKFQSFSKEVGMRAIFCLAYSSNCLLLDKYYFCSYLWQFALCMDGFEETFFYAILTYFMCTRKVIPISLRFPAVCYCSDWEYTL